MATSGTFEKALQSLGLVTPESLALARVESVTSGKSIEQVLTEQKLIAKEDVVKARAAGSGISYVYLVGQPIKQEVLAVIPQEVARSYRAAAFGMDVQTLYVAMEDPGDVQALSFIEKKAGRRVVPYLASAESVDYALGFYVSDISEDVRAALEAVKEGVETKGSETLSDTEAIAGVIKDAPITKAVNAIVEYAIQNRASDVHIEPREQIVVVRYRIDGVLRETMKIPKAIHAALISRIKILSNLKIDEHRLPQDGRFKVVLDGREIDIRVSISPIVFGEKVVMRILDKSAGVITVEQLGLRGRSLEVIRSGLEKPHGMTLVTGPTGSGKSTTLYAVLSKLNTAEVNIIT